MNFAQIERGLDLLERIVTALEQLVELERTQPLDKIIHPSSMRETFPPTPGETE